MSKRLCKLNRSEISQDLGNIYSLISDAKYLCRSCARSSNERSQLCKPTAIPEQYGVRKIADDNQITALTKKTPTTEVSPNVKRIISKKAVKKAKKQVKKQKKHVKKMAKIVKVQTKLMKKQKKIEQKLVKFNSSYSELNLPLAIH